MDQGDLALLNDLVDGRLDPVLEASVRGRLEREPELREAHRDLERMRAGLRDLPGPAVPADFAARVRARATGDASLAAARPRATNAFAYAAAATLALGVGLGAYVIATRDHEPATTDVVEAPTIPVSTRTAAEPAAPARDEADRESLRALEARAAKPASDASAGRGFAGPGGAVPPGLREPADARADEKAVSTPERRREEPSRAERPPPPAPLPVSAPPTTPGPPRPTTGVPVEPPAPLVVREGPVRVGARRIDSSHAGYREGVDAVFVLRATDYEEGNARLLLWVDEVKKDKALADAPKPEATESPEATPAPHEAPAAEPAPAAGAMAPAAATAEAEKRSAASPEPVLGTLVVHVTRAQLARLAPRLDRAPEPVVAALRKAADEDGGAKEPEAPPAAPAPEADDGGETAILRVRVLVVPGPK